MLEPLSTKLTSKARELLKTSHEKYDIYFSGFLHNHLSHGILSFLALGADDNELAAHHDSQIKMLQPRPAPSSESAGAVTAENWLEHLAKDTKGVKLSGDMMIFFDERLVAVDGSAFARDDMIRYAFDPRIASRLLGGAVHPLIHLGYACELAKEEPDAANLLLAESLSMQCTTRDAFAAAIASLLPLEQVNNDLTLKDGASAGSNRVLSVLEEMNLDDSLASVPPKDEPDKVDYTISRTDVMKRYYNMFPVELSEEGIQSALEQLFFAAVAVVFGSVSTTKEPRLDFFLAHLLTSAVSVRQILPHLLVVDGDDGDRTAGLAAAATLCRYHYVAFLAWYRARGHPSINMENLLRQPVPLTWEECEAAIRSKPSLEVHVCKVLRALQMGKTEPWATAFEGLQQKGVLPPGINTAEELDKLWLICANVLICATTGGGPVWLFGDAWDYYGSE